MRTTVRSAGIAQNVSGGTLLGTTLTSLGFCSGHGVLEPVEILLCFCLRLPLVLLFQGLLFLRSLDLGVRAAVCRGVDQAETLVNILRASGNGHDCGWYG